MQDDWQDPDDAPVLTEHAFEHGELSRGGVVVREATETLTRRGRPRAQQTKQLISLRLDRDVIERFRASGPGWQGRMNEVLKTAG